MLVYLRAISVHLLTASGAIFAMFAILEAAKGNWDTMYLWLLIAFFIDGIDGPLARRFDVQNNASIIDGDLLDLIIDYLTYVFIPSFALFQSDLLPGWTGWFSTLVITYSSALYFSDKRMKTSDKSFSGFPSCWNMVILVFFALDLNFWLITGIITILAIAMFLPIKFVHPVRTKRWRWISFPVATLWTVLAITATLNEFNLGPVASWGLLLTSFYLLTAGFLQMLIPSKDKSALV